jgi:hypothetical protein
MAISLGASQLRFSYSEEKAVGKQPPFMEDLSPEAVE